jgi:hypothetical protein
MNDLHEDTDARLTRLQAATAVLRPRPDFAARVAATIAREREGAEADWLSELFRPARRLVPVAAIAAAAGVLSAMQSEPAWHGMEVATSAAGLDTEW